MARNNECIEERSSSYRVRLFYYDENGKRTSISETFPFKKYGTKQKAKDMAKQWRDRSKVEIANNMIIKEKHFTLDEVFNGMMELYQCSLGTKKKVLGTYNKYIKSYTKGETRFSDIKFDDIQKCLNNMCSIAKDDTIQRAKGVWKRLYQYAIAKEIVQRDETFNVITPKSDLITIKKKMETSFEEVMNVVNLIDCKIENHRDSILMQGALIIMWYTGMRPAEVFALDKNNIDLDSKSLYVCQSVGSTSTMQNTIKKTKNEYSMRHIPIIDELIPVLKTLIDNSISDLLFIRDNGEIMNGNFLSSVCQRLTNNVFRPYTIRHQFATRLMTTGIDPRTIQELMGHKESTITIGYARSNDMLKKEALRLLRVN